MAFTSWYRRALLLGTAAAGVFSVALPAHAQSTDAPAGTGDEITVKGFRRGLATALEVKREDTAIVDAINADDIADFPDLNLAEALQRIPGVQIDRDGGEGRSISVRGLSSQFVRVQLNGMEALAVTGGRDGRANRNRQFDFNIFAAELFNSIKVSKSQEAETDEGSLGATVGLKTARPFDYKGLTIAAGAQAQYNDLSEETTPRGTFLISNRFFDDRFGVLFSAAYAERVTLEEGSSSGRFRVPADDGCVPTTSGGIITSYVGTTRCYQSVGTITTASGSVLTGLAAQEAAWNAAHPRIPRYGRIGYDRERLGLTGALQFKPNDRMEFAYDLLFAQLDETRSEEFLEVISFARETGTQGFRAVDLVNGRVDDNRTLVAGTFNDVDLRTEQRIDILENEFVQNTFEWSFDATDRLKLSALGGFSRSVGSNPQQTTISLDAYDVDGYSYDYSDPNLPAFDYVVDVTSPTAFGLSSSTALGDASIIRLRPNQSINTYETVRLDAAFDLNDAITLSGGFQYKEFGFEVTEERRASEAVPALTVSQLATLGITPDQYTRLLTGFGSGLDLPSGTPTAWIIPDLDALNALIDFDCDCVNAFGDFTVNPFASATQDVTEQSNGVYVQADWSTELKGMPFRGNVGVRYVETELEATGVLSGNLTTVEHSYDNTLPALNMVLEPRENVLVRFAAAKVIARAGLPALTPGGNIDANPPGLSLNTGNPFLAPTESTNYDLSFEWYPYEEALFSVAFFYKDIETFTQRLLTPLPYEQTGFPLDLLPVGVTPQDIFNVTTFVNTPGGELTGFEIAAQTPFTFLPAPFDRFGGLATYSKIDSEIDFITNVTTGATVTQPLIGQSPTSASGTLYYSHEGFEARLSGTYRDEYLLTVPAASGNDVEGKAETFNLDFSASYELNDRVSVSFEAINLTDQFDERWINSQRQNNLNYEHTGRDIIIGIRYRH